MPEHQEHQGHQGQGHQGQEHQEHQEHQGQSDHAGMMTLVAVAITTAFAYSAAVGLGLSGEVFFWELATLVDIMLLGHWVEMRSVMGASKALEELASLMPDEAHLLQED